MNVRQISRSLPLLCGLFLAVSLGYSNESMARDYLVQLRPSTSPDRQVARQFGGTYLRSSRWGRFDVVSFKGQSRAEERLALARLRRHPSVLSVTPNYAMSSSTSPNDPYYDTYQWNLKYVQFEALLDAGANGKDVVVAVLDSGVAYANYGIYRRAPQLNPDRFVAGWDFVNNDAFPNDDNGHGTHMAAIIIQKTGDASGSAGLAHSAKVMPVKVLDHNGRGTLESLINGIDFARTNGAKVINLSLNFPPGTPSSPLLEQALASAYNAGIVLVGAAGNDAAPNVSLPAANNYVIAVGASTKDGTPTSYSNHGAALDLLAPGGDTRDTDGNGRPDAILQTSFAPGSPAAFHHYFGIGTSQAAAHVSAAAAILLKRSDLGSNRPLKVRNLLQQKAKMSGSWSSKTGYGIVQVYDSWVLKPVPTKLLHQWQGYVTTPLPAYPQGIFAVIHQHPASGLWAFLATPTEGLFCLVDDPSGDVLMFDVPGTTLATVYGQGVQAFINSRGGLPGLRASASRSSLIGAAQGLISILDGSGALVEILDRHSASGTTVTLIWSDPTGQVVDQILDSGGLMSLLNISGGLMSLLNISGGLMSLLNISGGLMSLLNISGDVMSVLDAAGEPLGLVAGSSFGSMNLLSNGLLDPPMD